MPRRKSEEPKRSVSLHIGSSFASAWESVLLPWLEHVLPETWKCDLPSLAVVPTRGQANDLKRRLIAKGVSHLGLQIVTPTSLSAFLARRQRFCARWIVWRLPVGNSKNCHCPRLPQ